MLKTLGVVEACYGSTFSRTKASRRLGGKSVLQWVARRATECLRLEGVIVVTCDLPENCFVPDLVPPDVPVFIGRHADKLGTLAAALEEYPAESAVLIRGDSVFLDPILLDRLVITAEEQGDCDYIGYGSRDGRPAVLSPVSVYGEWFRTAALRKAAKRATEPADRDQPTRYLFSHPDKFKIRLLQAPASIDRDDVRLTVDIEEDWEHAVAIFEAIGPDEMDWQRIADLLDHQPALRKRMAALNRAHVKG